jgi:ornithine carbamoyltransferase
MPALSLSTQRLSRGAPLPMADALTLVAAARRLQADLQNGAAGKPLRGKNLALLLGGAGGAGGAETSALHEAAQELGARVAEVRFAEPPGTRSRDGVRQLARMLGRLYDAVDCAALPPATVREIEQEAGVPVYDGLALDDHPARALADLMTLDEHRRAQAVASSILFLGDARTMRASAFLSLAHELGFEVRLGRPAAPAETAFVVDATHPRWTLHAPAGPLGDTLRSAMHRRVMQAVLIDSLAGA